METEHLTQVRDLINQIADCYDLPSKEQTEEMGRLTGVAWDAGDLQMLCCEYWSHHSLEETAYLMFHGRYPPVHETDLIFWRSKPGAVLDDRAVYEKYRLGKGTLKALEALPLEEILETVRERFPNWRHRDENGCSYRESWRFDCLEQEAYWTDTHFWIFEYGRETEARREHQILRFSCHNMNAEQIGGIMACMAQFRCPLHLREDYSGADAD